MLGVAPAQQCLGADHAAVGEVVDGLVEHAQFATLPGAAKLALQRHPAFDGLVHRPAVEAVAVLAGHLGLVHRDVAVLHQLRGDGGVVGEQRDADGRAQEQRPVAHHQRLARGFHQVLPKVVADCLVRTGLDASCLHLELTETAVIGDEAQVSRLLADLRQQGVKIWLDDFGTGFSGLSHLRRVPIDGVKIDRSFIADILRDPDDLALTTAIISMAHSLGITVVAEGIESEGQYRVLLERGCDQGQGFWFGRPMGAGELAAQFKP